MINKKKVLLQWIFVRILLATIVVMGVVVEKRSHSLFINLHCLEQECLAVPSLVVSKLLFEKAPKQIPPPPKKRATNFA
jgi:hypothetical protein